VPVLSASTFGCFFLDSSVILTEAFENLEYINRVQHFLANLTQKPVQTFIGSRVEAECKKKVEIVTNFIGETFRELMEFIANEKIGSSSAQLVTIEVDDLKLIQKYFRSKVAALPTRKQQPYSTERNS